MPPKKTKKRQSPPHLELRPRELRRDDGRYLIYYEFTKKGEGEKCQS